MKPPWATSNIISLIAAAMIAGDRGQLPVLADALEDAGGEADWASRLVAGLRFGEWDAVGDLLARLAGGYCPATFRRIAPVQWTQSDDHDGYTRMTASTILGMITVEHVLDGDRYQWSYCVDEYYDEGRQACDTLTDAIAQAEAWYTGRLAPALVPV